MHLACSESTFQAPTSGTCLQHLAGGVESNQHTFSVLAERFCRKPFSLESQMILADLGPLNMFVLTSG